MAGKNGQRTVIKKPLNCSYLQNGKCLVFSMLLYAVTHAVMILNFQEWFSTRLKNFALTKNSQTMAQLTVESPLYDVSIPNLFLY